MSGDDTRKQGRRMWYMLRVECTILNRVTKEGLTWKVTFEQRCEGDKGASYGEIWKNIVPAAGTGLQV